MVTGVIVVCFCRQKNGISILSPLLLLVFFLLFLLFYARMLCFRECPSCLHQSVSSSTTKNVEALPTARVESHKPNLHLQTERKDQVTSDVSVHHPQTRRKECRNHAQPPTPQFTSA